MSVKKKSPIPKPKTHEIGVFLLARNRQGKYLMVLQNNGLDRFTFPGGKVKPGEKLLTALKREILEETGYRIKSLSEHPPTVLERRGKDYLGLYFHGETEYLPTRQPKAKEIAGVVWVKPENAKRELKRLGPQAQIIIMNLLRNKRPHWNCLQTKKRA